MYNRLVQFEPQNISFVLRKIDLQGLYWQCLHIIRQIFVDYKVHPVSPEELLLLSPPQ